VVPSALDGVSASIGAAGFSDGAALPLAPVFDVVLLAVLLPAAVDMPSPGACAGGGSAQAVVATMTLATAMMCFVMLVKVARTAPITRRRRFH